MIRSEMIVILSQALAESVSKREVQEVMRNKVKLVASFSGVACSLPNRL